MSCGCRAQPWSTHASFDKFLHRVADPSPDEIQDHGQDGDRCEQGEKNVLCFHMATLLNSCVSLRLRRVPAVEERPGPGNLCPRDRIGFQLGKGPDGRIDQPEYDLANNLAEHLFQCVRLIVGKADQRRRQCGIQGGNGIDAAVADGSRAAESWRIRRRKS